MGYGYDAYVCPKCNFIDNKFRFMLSADKKRFVPKYSCNICGHDLRIRKNKEEFKLKCDYCGSEEFEKESDYINWD